MNRFTLSGLLAVLFWSSTVAFSRALSEALGPLTAGGLIYTLSGLLGLAVLARQPGGLPELGRMPRLYLFGCGALFVLYELLLYTAIGLAADRTQVLAVGLANYLWPALIMLFSLPILGRRARFWLLPGILLALSGIWTAVLGSQETPGMNAGLFTPAGLRPVLLAAGAAVLWGLYSNLVRKWGPASGSAAPVFLLASGLIFSALRLVSGEVSHFSWDLAPQILYMAVFPSWLGYLLWDFAMRRGDMVLVSAFSYFTPLLSTLISLLVLGISPTPLLGLAAALVCAGAVLSKLGVD